MCNLRHISQVRGAEQEHENSKERRMINKKQKVKVLLHFSVPPLFELILPRSGQWKSLHHHRHDSLSFFSDLHYLQHRICFDIPPLSLSNTRRHHPFFSPSRFLLPKFPCPNGIVMHDGVRSESNSLFTFPFIQSSLLFAVLLCYSSRMIINDDEPNVWCVRVSNPSLITRRGRRKRIRRGMNEHEVGKRKWEWRGIMREK